MKEGRLSSVGFSIGFVSSGVSALSRAHLSMAPSAAVMSWWEAAPVAQFSSGPSCGQGRGGACRSKRLIGGQHVPDRLGEAAGDVDGGDLGAALLAVAGVDALADGAVERVAEGGVRCFDQRPAQVVGSVFAQRAAPVASARLLDAWAEAGVAGELAGRREAVDVADLGGDREGEDPADPGAGQQQRDVSVVGAERSQLALAAVDLLVEGVDQGERGGQRRGPRLWQLQPLEQPAAAGAEEVAARVGHAVLEEDRVDAVFERASVLDQVQPEARPLTLGPDRRVGQPDLRDEVEPGELGQHPGVDRVGLASQRRDPTRLRSVGDPDVPARELELVVDKTRAAHRLNHSQHAIACIAQSLDELRQPIAIGRDGADADAASLTLERMPVKTLAAQIQSDVQQRRGLPSSRTGRTEFRSAGGPPSSDSVGPICAHIEPPCVLAWRPRAVARNARPLPDGALMLRIACLPGDGIGPEVTAAAVRVLESLPLEVVVEEHPFGGGAIHELGDPLPEETLSACRAADAVLLGAVGLPELEGAPVRPEQGLIRLRGDLDVYANLRPTRGDGVDLLIVRELVGGLYFGASGRRPDGSAFDTCEYSPAQIERIARRGFEFARQRSARLTSVDKANVLETSRLWREIVTGLADEYADVQLEHMLVDNAGLQLVQNPGRFDVLVTENTFGDILSDVAAGTCGGLGLAASASLGDARPGIFEPVHGSAPDIAGRGIANPAATLRSAALLLLYGANEPQLAYALERAVDAALESTPTRDIGGTATTEDFTEAVVRAFDRAAA